MTIYVLYDDDPTKYIVKILRSDANIPMNQSN